MALDNAQFMSELSITDPPGTDPLSEGDDQIRTSKRTQQQSFPNVDAAVTLTAAQLNDVALQSEANTFALLQTFSANIRFQNDADRGIQWANGAAEFVWEMLSLQGSNDTWRLGRYNAGIFVDNPISISNVSGEATFVNDLVMELNGGTFRSVFYKDGGLNRWSAGVNGTTDAYEIGRYDAGGTFVNTPFTIFSSGSFLFRTAFVTIQRPGVGENTQLVFQNETVNRWFWRFNAGNGRFQMVRLSGTGSEQDTPFECDTNGALFMILPTGPTGISGQLYAKQSQTFAPTELILGQTP